MSKALKYSGWLVLAGLLYLLVWLPDNLRGIQDWFFLQTYNPSVEVVQLAQQAKLSDHGREIYYASDPQLQPKNDFSLSCDFAEFNIVVGCYDGRKIYILDIENENLEPGEYVTAAHEMLHAVYDRLKSDELLAIDSLLIEQAEKISDSNVLETMSLYYEQSPESYTNELHAIFGTEVEELLPELEDHYSKYFTNRSSLVEIAKKYDKIFSDLEEEADELAEQLNVLADELNDSGKQLKAWFNELEVGRVDLQRRIDSGEYTSSLINAINKFEAEVVLYNKDVAIYRIGLAEYDSLRERYDEIALRHENLVNSIDSSYTPEGIVE